MNFSYLQLHLNEIPNAIVLPHLFRASLELSDRNEKRNPWTKAVFTGVAPWKKLFSALASASDALMLGLLDQPSLSAVSQVENLPHQQMGGMNDDD